MFADPTAEVIALSPRTLMATNRFVCEVCNKGFQRDQNLQLHRRGHNLPWKLKQRATTEARNKVYVCPEITCLHHDPSRALGDLTGIKKHFSRKHGEKKWKCDKCSKKYAVQSDWKAHSKVCGTKEYTCDCGTIFSRRDSFITHRAFCDALAEENNKLHQGSSQLQGQAPEFNSPMDLSLINQDITNPLNNNMPHTLTQVPNIPDSSFSDIISGQGFLSSVGLFASSGLNNTRVSNDSNAFMSATALLQKAAQMGAKVSSNAIAPPIFLRGFPDSTSGLYMGSQNGFPKELEKISLPDSPLMIHGEKSIKPPGEFLEGESMMRGLQREEAAKRAGERMTVDFLGVGVHGDGMGYSSHGQQEMLEWETQNQQRSFDKMPGFHHVGQDQASMERPIWDF
ncbi:hypothetical protein AMTRI_Chr06g191390 [Amborella trichopoda]